MPPGPGPGPRRAGRREHPSPDHAAPNSDPPVRSAPADVRSRLAGNGLYARQAHAGQLHSAPGGPTSRPAARHDPPPGHAADHAAHRPPFARAHARSGRPPHPAQSAPASLPSPPTTIPSSTGVRALPGLLVATGYFAGNGFVLGPAVGLVVSQLICTGQAELDLTPLRLDRFTAAYSPYLAAQSNKRSKGGSIRLTTRPVPQRPSAAPGWARVIKVFRPAPSSIPATARSRSSATTGSTATARSSRAHPSCAATSSTTPSRKLAHPARPQPRWHVDVLVRQPRRSAYPTRLSAPRRCHHARRPRALRVVRRIGPLRRRERDLHSRHVIADDRRLFDREPDWPFSHKRTSIVAEERIIVDGAVGPGMVKVIWAFCRKPGLTIEEFQTHWHDIVRRHAARRQTPRDAPVRPRTTRRARPTASAR